MKLSIITVVYNGLKDFEKTVNSIKNQNNKNFEYIVVDGGSTDGCLNFIKTEALIDKYISEPDKGIYDAMNKGVELASGEYILFLNAGDIFANEKVIQSIVTSFAQEYDVFYGDVVLVMNKEIKKIQPQKLTQKYLLINNLCHQSMILKRSLLQNQKYDINIPILADYKHLLEIFKMKKTFCHIGVEICKYENCDGVSSKMNKISLLQNRAKIVREVLGRKYFVKFIYLNIFLKPINFVNTYMKVRL